MKWLEISVEVESEEASRAVGELFDRYGHGGAVLEQLFLDQPRQDGHFPPVLAVKAYLRLGSDGEERLQTLDRELSELASLYPIHPAQFEELEDAEWADAWKVFFRPLRVGRRLVLKLPENSYSASPEDIIVDLDPGMAFGTGQHATTRMCLVCLEELVQPGDRVLDMGTGSGILAIAAAKLGAESVLAMDKDSTAVAAARANVALNAVHSIVHVEGGSLESLEHLGVPLLDGILINIIADVIVDMMGRGLTGYLKPGGWLVAGGIVARAEGKVRRAFADEGIQMTAYQAEDEWVTLTGVKAGSVPVPHWAGEGT